MRHGDRVRRFRVDFVSLGTGWRRRLASVLVVVLDLTPGGSTVRPDWRAPREGVGIRFISARDLHGMLARGESLTLVDARDEAHYHLDSAEDAPLWLLDVRRPKRLLHPERLLADRAGLVVFHCGGPN